MKRIVLKFLAHESGATAIEYGLIAALIALAILAALNTTGSALAEKLNFIASQLK